VAIDAAAGAGVELSGTCQEPRPADISSTVKLQ
jgi:hypothetical protein